MVQPVELRYGVWLEGSPDEGMDVLTLCGLMADCIADAVLSLAMYQDAMMLPGPPTGDAWRAIRDRDYQARRAREAELEAEHPWGPDGDQERHEWHRAIRDQADRDVTHAKWAAGELPQTYIARLCVIHKDSFMTSLARLRRALRNLTEFDAARGSAEIQAAIAAFDAALPNLTALRDSAEHSEDRLLGRDKHGNPLKAVPTTGTGRAPHRHDPHRR